MDATLRCPACGATNPSLNRFCGGCGAPTATHPPLTPRSVAPAGRPLSGEGVESAEVGDGGPPGDEGPASIALGGLPLIATPGPLRKRKHRPRTRRERLIKVVKKRVSVRRFVMALLFVAAAMMVMFIVALHSDNGPSNTQGSPPVVAPAGPDTPALTACAWWA